VARLLFDDCGMSLIGTRPHGAASKWAIFALVSVGTFMTTLDASIVNIALPSIAAAFGTPVSGPVEWVVIGYLVVLAATLLSFSRLADIVGRERVWVSGLVVFTAGSALSGLAPTLVLLVAARCLQGLGAAMIFAPALALIVDAFPRSQRGQALGMNALIVSLGVTAGPTLGGLITDSLGWRWIFYVNVPLGFIGLLIARRVFTFARGAEPRRFDIPGAVAFGLGLASLSLGLSFGSEWGWTSPALILTIAVAIVSLVSGIYIERRQVDPLLDIDQLISRRLGLPLLSFLFAILALFSVGFLMPFYFEELRGFTPLEAGLLVTPYSLGLAFTAPIAGRLVDRGQARWSGTVGLGMAAAAFVLLAQTGVSTPIAFIVVSLALAGIGQGMFLSPNTTAVMSAVPADQSSIASGLIATTRAVSQALSVALAGAVFIGFGGAAAGAALSGGVPTAAATAALDGTFLGAFHAALLVSGLMAAAGAITSLPRLRAEPSDVSRRLGARPEQRSVDPGTPPRIAASRNS
jgi:EmrB/QacA subfamily drug resistance transporter